MILPREILEHIAGYLGSNDQYSCLTVCKAWHPTFLYCLYRHIHLLSDEKSGQLQSTMRSHRQLGSLVRHVSFQKTTLLKLGLGVHIVEHGQLKVTQEMLDALSQACSLMESLQFDQNQWASSALTLPSPLLLGLRRLPILNFSLFTHIMAENSSKLHRLTHLHIRGNIDMIQHRNSAIDLLAYTPHLTQLIFERDELHNKYKAPVISLEHIDRLHRYLPHLADLQFINHFNFGISNYYIHQIQPAISTVRLQRSLKHLRLEGTLQSYQWMQYIAQQYPSLEYLTLDLVHSPFSGVFAPPPMQFINHKIRESFQTIADQYQHLRILRIRGLSTPLWLAPNFVAALEKKPFLTEIDAQLYGLDFEGVEKSIQALASKEKSVNLTGIRLPIWRRHCHQANPLITWRDTIKPLQAFEGLTHLELDAVSMSYVNTLNGGDGFDLDTILSIIPTLTSLKLSGSTLQLSEQAFSHRNNQTSSKLHELTLHKIAFSGCIMDYLPQYCPGLKRLIMYDCQQQQSGDNQKLKISIGLQPLDLDLIVLYRVRHSSQLAESRAFSGARFLCVNGQNWSHLSIKQGDGACEARPLREQFKIKQITDYNEILLEEWDPSRARYHTAEEWMQDVVFGYIDVQCKSANKIFLDGCLVVS
ncbi:hypothetical protein MAM1_0251c08745 [Mucor ambiguus]|uniref:F-box domain-containing protein n=1 Tax=Mucor ambiguus TaxID=91626 RepID=A0A0C9MZY6_9FUNG|nr:hypothetical protein MAM1_0251c08745 [Mucor ambiguus]